VLDFEEYCRKKSVNVERRIFLSTDRGGRVLKGVRPNLFAESAVYLLSRGRPPAGGRNGE
jgi:hypothetical protein